jgi:hypothetical protein
LQSSSGVTLDGRSFGAETRTAQLVGSSADPSVRPIGGRYVVQLPPHGASMLTAR